MSDSARTNADADLPQSRFAGWTRTGRTMLHQSTSLRLSKFEVASLQTWPQPKTRWRCFCRGHAIASLTWVLRWLGYQASEDLYVFPVGHGVPMELDEKVANLHVPCGAHSPYSGTSSFPCVKVQGPLDSASCSSNAQESMQKKRFFPDFLVSWMCWDFRSAGRSPGTINPR